MKVLLDQNLSVRLEQFLEDCFEQVLHVRTAGLENATDLAIWNFAREEGFVIMTRDSDFNDLNKKTPAFAALLKSHLDLIVEFESRLDVGLLEIFH
jgi:predicted nuclease of predicted toxin-antitoxin system